MKELDQILLKMQTAQNLRWEDPELAEVFARSALEEVQALGYVSASLHFQLADLLDDLGKHAQAFREVRAGLELDGARSWIPASDQREGLTLGWTLGQWPAPVRA